MPTTLIEPAALAAHLAHPTGPSSIAVSTWHALSGRARLAAGHVPIGVVRPSRSRLSGPRTALTVGIRCRRSRRSPATFGRWGIDKEVQVVATNQDAGAYAARLVVAAALAGTPARAVLDGGFAAWERAGLPLETAATVRAPRRFTGRPRRRSGRDDGGARAHRRRAAH